MATYLYIFPHPDDESFGPGPVMARQRREGHDVHLVTLTRGEATSQRHRLGYSKSEMGAARYDEMQNVADALDLTSLTVRAYPDGELAELNPLLLEEEVAGHLHRTEPDVVVTYPVHGISGHPDHLVTHQVVKRVVCALRADGVAYPKRLAFFTLHPPPGDGSGGESGDAASAETAAPDGASADPEADDGRPAHLRHSPAALIDCVVEVTEADVERGQAALDCYVTYQPVVEAHQPLRLIEAGTHFEIYGERHDPPLADLTDALPASSPAGDAPRWSPDAAT